jgi:SagB-type dehydrogenase family enzyme
MFNKIGKEFMKKTRYEYLEDNSDQMKGIPQPPLELDYDKTKNIIDLPDPKGIEINNINLRELVENRKSVRDYSEQPITIKELSYLLWCTQGVKEIIPKRATIRTVPSAGARHSIETYLLINNIEGLKPGLYRFLAIKHKLIEVNLESDIADKITVACLEQDFVKTCAVTFIWVAVQCRMTWRYSERGYRYLHLDAGHICQNLYLSAESIDCGVCAIGAFEDKELNNFIGIDGEELFVIYLATVGKKRV